VLDVGNHAPDFSLNNLDGTEARLERGSQSKPRLIMFFETDCPTCLLTIPYINRLARELGEPSAILGISQDAEGPTRHLIDQAPIEFPVAVDRTLSVTKLYDPVAVPTLFLIGADGRIAKCVSGFDKRALNEIASMMADAPLIIAEPFDGAPANRDVRRVILNQPMEASSPKL
jgi:peroxiredoxin